MPHAARLAEELAIGEGPVRREDRGGLGAVVGVAQEVVVEEAEAGPPPDLTPPAPLSHRPPFHRERGETCFSLRQILGGRGRPLSRSAGGRWERGRG